MHHCGRPLNGGGIAGAPTQYPFFPVATHKFVVMAVCTFNIYELYWCFKNWQRIRQRSGESLSPFWRGFFALIWSFSLFGRIRDYAHGQAISVHWSAGLLGTVYFLISAALRLPDPWWLISYASFIPFIAVVQTIQEINVAAPAAENSNTSYSGANIATIFVGGLLVILAITGALLPE